VPLRAPHCGWWSNDTLDAWLVMYVIQALMG